jgi:hypothetical protein
MIIKNKIKKKHSSRKAFIQSSASIASDIEAAATSGYSYRLRALATMTEERRFSNQQIIFLFISNE